MLRVVAAGAWVLISACGGGTTFGTDSSESFSWVQKDATALRDGKGAFSVRWSRQLTPQDDSKYVPVEYAEPAFDPRRNAIYIGTTRGTLYAFDIDGHRRFKHDVSAAIESAPVVDRETGEVFVGDMNGTLHALDADGAPRWTQQVSTSIRRRPVLSSDAVYTISEEDRVVASSRKDGATLWAYEEDRIEEMTIAGHAGVTLVGSKLLTGFNSGRVAALDASDGSAMWVFDTSTDIELTQSDVPQFFDVDTTPVVIEDVVYVASFTGGLYALDLDTGSVRWRDEEMTGITGLANAGNGFLVVTSSQSGVSLLDIEQRKTRWSRRPERGAPSHATVTQFGTVLVGESQGSLLALDLSNGEELGRAEGGYGFSAAPGAAANVGVALSNGGRLLCLRLR